MNSFIRIHYVDNPMITDAMKADGSGKRKIEALIDERELWGGFCRFNGNESQKAAAARFRSLHDQGQLGGSKAVDFSKEAVDGGGINPEMVFVMGAGSREGMREARRCLGETDFKRFSFVVLGECGPTQYAKWRHAPSGVNKRIIDEYSKEIYDIADTLAKLWNYA